MKILLKALGVITALIVVSVSASLIGSKNGVDIHSGRKYSAVETVAQVTQSTSEAKTETTKNSSLTTQPDNTGKSAEESGEAANITNEYENDSTIETEIPFVGSIDDLVGLINKSSDRLDKNFTVILNPSLNMDTLLEDIPEDAIRHLTTISYSAVISGDEITSTFMLEYKDHFSVLRAFRDESLTALLTGNEKALLNKSKEIVAEIINDGMTEYEKEKTIHDYLVANYQYDNQVNTGNFTNLSYSGYGLLFNGIGVCDAYARIMYILANMVDIECLYVVGYAGGDTENYGHAWNKIKIDGDWYNVDVTWNDPLPDEKGRVLYDYFNVTDEFLSKDHVWNREFYPEANVDKQF